MSAPVPATSIEAARQQLAAFAVTYAQQPASGAALRQLEAAARLYASAVADAASGVTAAKSQAARDEKRGVRLCPSCAVPIAPAAGADGGPMQWIDAKTFQPHRCGR